MGPHTLADILDPGLERAYLQTSMLALKQRTEIVPGQSPCTLAAIRLTQSTCQRLMARGVQAGPRRCVGHFNCQHVRHDAQPINAEHLQSRLSKERHSKKRIDLGMPARGAA